jgi:FAD synthase
MERRIIVPGKFDALHVGHRALVRRAASYGKPLILTFSGMAELLGREALLPIVARSHMQLVVQRWFSGWQREQASSAIDDLGERAPLAATDFEVMIIPFAQVRHLSPEDFIVQYLYRELGARGIVCGGDWRFGYRAAGDVTLLKQLSERLQTASPDGWVFDTVPSVLSDGEKVSSSRIRRHLAAGRVHQAARMLDRFHWTAARCVALQSEGESLDLLVERWENQPPAPHRLYECRVDMQPLNAALLSASNSARKCFEALVWIEDRVPSIMETAYRSQGLAYCPSRLRLWPLERRDRAARDIAIQTQSARHLDSIALDRAITDSHAHEVIIEFRDMVAASKPLAGQHLPTAGLMPES